MSDRRRPTTKAARSAWGDEIPPLPMTADASRGATNLATVPRAGNISTDTRAGRRSGVGA